MSIIFKQECNACVDTPLPNKSTLFVDNEDGVLKIKGQDGIARAISCGSSFTNLAFGNGSDGCCHITCADGDCLGHVFMCSGKYNFTSFIVDEGVTLYFCGNDTVEIKALDCFCNLGVINTRGTIVCPSTSSIFLIGGVANIQNTGTLPAFAESGCSYCYCNGGDGCSHSYSTMGGGSHGGCSYWCNGGNGGSDPYGGKNGGRSYYGNGGGGGNSGSSSYPGYNSATGGSSYTGNGGNGGSGGCDCPNYYGYGGSSLGGAYGLYIGAPKIHNNCIYAKGGNGGSSGNAERCGCGTSGGQVLISYQDCITCGSINVLGGTGKNNPIAGCLFIQQIPGCF